MNIDKNKKWLFIGDSYGVAQNSWIDECARMLNIPTNLYHNLAVAGSGFTTAYEGYDKNGNYIPDIRWQRLLERWASGHLNELQDIGYIVVGGGANDSYQIPNTPIANGVNPLSSCMYEFSNYAKVTFPNAKIYCAYFGWCVDTSIVYNNGLTAEWRAKTQYLYSRCATFGMAYLSGCELVMHDRSLLVEDGLHPNAAGGTVIAEAISNALMTGYASVKKYGLVNIIPLSGKVTGRVEQTISDGNCFVQFNNFAIMNCRMPFVSNKPIKIANIHLPFSNKFYTQARIGITTIDKKNKFYDCALYADKNELFIKVFDDELNNKNVSKIGVLTSLITVNPYWD